MLPGQGISLCRLSRKCQLVILKSHLLHQGDHLFKAIHLYTHTLPFSCEWGWDSYLLQHFQALVHSQNISKCSGSLRSNPIPSKTVEESSE